jgi:superfamily II DNA helicase RecQ
VYWDIASGDDARPLTRHSVRNQLEAETRELATGTVDLIYLFHDINEVTSEHLTDFIEAIDLSVRANGNTPIFVADRAEVELIMDKRSREGTDTPCPADSMG